MEIDFYKIKEMYDKDIIDEIKQNKEDIANNINYLYTLNFNDVIDIFERYPLLFITPPKEFEENINKLIIKLGQNYVEIIENDLSILEKML